MYFREVGLPNAYDNAFCPLIQFHTNPTFQKGLLSFTRLYLYITHEKAKIRQAFSKDVINMSKQVTPKNKDARKMGKGRFSEQFDKILFRLRQVYRAVFGNVYHILDADAVKPRNVYPRLVRHDVADLERLVPA